MSITYMKLDQNLYFCRLIVIGKYEITITQYREFDTTILSTSQDNLPITNVSWYEAEKYCEWLSKVTGDEYRLPYEIEWEIACKGHTDNLFAWGNDLPDRNNCNFLFSTVGKPIANNERPYNPNINGIFNMSGNVAEWCKDWYHLDYYKQTIYDSVNKRIIDLSKAKDEKTIRGGSYKDIPFDLRCTSRKPAKSTQKESHIGFRVLKICKTKKKEDQK